VISVSFNMRRRLSAVLTLATLACFLAFFSFGWLFVFPPDSGWLLKTGEYILQNAALPQHDLYSWTVPDKPWVIYQWLYEAIMAVPLMLGHLWLAGLAAFALAGVLLMFVMPNQWLRRGVPVWITFGMLTLALNEVWFQLRPQIASYFMILAFVATLEKYRQGGSKRWLWLLPPLMVLWTNLHSFWFIGLLAILCYALTAGSGRRWLWLTLALSTAAVLINPYGLGIVTYNWLFVTDVTQEIAELKSPFYFHTNETFLFFGYILCTWAIFIARHRKVPSAGLLFSAIATIAALRYARFMPVAILATWPYAGLALSTARPNPMFHQRWFATTQLLLAIAFPMAVWWQAVPTPRRAAELFTAQQLDGLLFTQQHRLPDERLYNDESLGSRLLFFGARKVFIDNRFDFYGKQFDADWMVAHYGDPGWKEYLQRYGVNAIAISEGEPLKKRLLADPDWLLVYDDGTMSYWITDTPEHQALISQWNMTPDKIGNAQISQAARSRTLASLTLRQKAVRYLANQHFAAGFAAARANKIDEAIEEFRRAVHINPHDSEYQHQLIHTLAVARREQELADALRAARPFFWQLPGEPIGPADPNRAYTAEQRRKIDAWVSDSTKQLLEKYKK
jgi:hypothetical protein